MIYSMTAFSRYEIIKNNCNIIWQLRSVNHKYLEISINLPDQIKHLEQVISKKIKKNIFRGKLDCNLYIYCIEKNQDHILINKILINQLVKLILKIKNKIDFGIINFIDLLKWPGVVIKQNVNNINEALILKHFECTLDKLLEFRLFEGEELRKIVEKKLFSINLELNKLSANLITYLKEYRKKLNNKIREINVKYDTNRLEQEIAIIISKTDINEEIDRISIHIKRFFDILNSERLVGMKLNFILQEMIRESNTIASKAININIIKSAIEIKILTEQIREQIQNIE
ncbi:YicC family protein [Wigglesworthia glossinidia endosymbiont of Glossina morsitans morsitans (Yale colony)]|uniref:YicC family protein n=1 Tax=Wigglesworthia glossinidia endosymbiont of Glossina morsitans morsitans (Yale colony) TaxID=1142511 RepID=H6Q5J3_WIGGL|nr:YicC/YloC family endoribonuclease [Wigglesworthia glossinidia]AFA41476.1 YicC family protein [Wigglesworthia glossinidia endosymbiont of Glossina morsitans morsitans (Yale colony)]